MLKTTLVSVLTIVFSSTLAAATATAQTVPAPAVSTPSTPIPPPPSGIHPHDGFYLRLSAGAGPSTMTASGPDGKGTFSGTGTSTAIAAGTTVGDNLMVFGEVQATVIDNPSLEMDGQSGQQDGTHIVSIMIGPGVTYYFQPINLFVSGTLGVHKLQLKSNGQTQNADHLGAAVSLSVGKEWWVSNDWGLGVSARVYSASNKDDDGTTMRTTGLSVCFSATFN